MCDMKKERFQWEVLDHPPYTPDLTPSDFHLFGPLKKHLGVGDRLTNRSINEHFHERFFVFGQRTHIRITNTFKKDFLCLENEHIIGGDQGYTPEIMDEILTTARDLELEVNEDDIEELIIGYEDELTTEFQAILNEEHQETQRNVSPSKQEEDERGPMPTSAVKDLSKSGRMFELWS
ncbi:hypothetical protein TNCV_1767521 [Trichonephila clavipes]|nr:hypothetical protein TNCV_1767521 [Trichonephila clavipes]